ncbi:hypothetical protein C8Q73DRAFT_712546 [Cubamyces lactineus]|nr:hypothetical protein C8Q73DRAFT_712546 [Cubamyces lactineus]
MRLKVESVPPLPHVKAWFSANALPSILDLKTSLCADLQPLSNEHVRPDHILLLLDDFELLDSSPIDVVRDGDLIVIKKRPSPPQPKRKAPESASPSRKRPKLDDGRAAPHASTKRRTSVKPPAPVTVESTSESDSSSDSSGSEDEEDSSESDTDSDSSDASSDSDSDSSSTSTSSSASSSSSEPETRSSRQKQTNGKKATTTAAKSQTSKPAPPPVPPGYGKPTTHSRNLRRRRKKMYERLSLTAEPTSVNDIPLGPRAHTHEPTAAAASTSTPASASVEPETQPVRASGKGQEPARETTSEAPSFMMASLQNKNKRRGFKSAMSQGVPPKIVFPDAIAAPGPSTSAQQQSMDVDPDAQLVEAALNPSPPAATPAIARAQPRLVPPSEKQERGQIPANMFVTSVDVEEGMWNAKGKKKNKKKKKVQVEEKWDYAEEEAAEEADMFAGGLPYDDVPETSMGPAISTTIQKDPTRSNCTEYAVVAAQWDTLRKITDKAQLQPGTTIGWKALGINFATFTPEILLHVGRVISCDEQLVVEPIAEPSPAAVSFGGVVDPEEGGPAEETFEWSDVFQGDWRLVSVR